MITVYSKNNCVYCNRAKTWLEKNGFEYRTVDITVETQARDFLVQEGHRSVPQMYVEGRLLVEGGFEGLDKLSPDELRQRIVSISAPEAAEA